MTNMNRRKNILAVLRRQRDRLGRLAVGLFAAASFTITGAPCFAMMSSGTDAFEQPTAEAPSHEHDAHHGHAAGHPDADPAAAHGDGSQHKAPAHCPHCPLPGVMPNHLPSSAHSLCSAF